jgi:hypothetical protein
VFKGLGEQGAISLSRHGEQQQFAMCDFSRSSPTRIGTTQTAPLPLPLAVGVLSLRMTPSPTPPSPLQPMSLSSPPPPPRPSVPPPPNSLGLVCTPHSSHSWSTCSSFSIESAHCASPPLDRTHKSWLPGVKNTCANLPPRRCATQRVEKCWV